VRKSIEVGVKDRKEREKAELQEKILDAANQLFVEEGYEKTSIRKIARRVEYSPGTVYLYFKNKKDLFLALQKRAFRRFYQAFEQVAATPHPGERLVKLGRNYLRFALQHPEYYDLMFIMRQPMQAIDEEQSGWKIGERNYFTLRQTVCECMDHGLLQRENPDHMAMVIWSTVHGLASLYIRKRFRMFDPADLDFHLRDAYTLLNRILLGPQQAGQIYGRTDTGFDEQ